MNIYLFIYPVASGAKCITFVKHGGYHCAAILLLKENVAFSFTPNYKILYSKGQISLEKKNYLQCFWICKMLVSRIATEFK